MKIELTAEQLVVLRLASYRYISVLSSQINVLSNQIKPCDSFQGLKERYINEDRALTEAIEVLEKADK